MSGYSTGIEQMQEKMGFSSEVGTVGLSLYVVSKHSPKQGAPQLTDSTAWIRGRSVQRFSQVTCSDLYSSLGPMFLAPLSEYWGRRPVYLVSWTIFTIFQIPVSLLD